MNKTNNNFKKAVNELLGNSTDDNMNGKDESMVPPFLESNQKGQPEYEDRTSYARGADTTYAQSSSPEAAPYQNMKTSTSDSLIAADMDIVGNLSSKTNITICGRVSGNITCSSNMVIRGEVEGDITAVDIEIFGSISGNITATGKVTISNNAHVNGNITARDVCTSGLVEGDIKVEEMAYFHSTAAIVGDTYAKTFEMTRGAKIKGLVKTYNSNMLGNLYAQ